MRPPVLLCKWGKPQAVLSAQIPFYIVYSWMDFSTSSVPWLDFPVGMGEGCIQWWAELRIKVPAQAQLDKLFWNWWNSLFAVVSHSQVMWPYWVTGFGLQTFGSACPSLSLNTAGLRRFQIFLPDFLVRWDKEPLCVQSYGQDPLPGWEEKGLLQATLNFSNRMSSWEQLETTLNLGYKLTSWL